MTNLWLVKIGEISLKKGNRRYFERILKENIRRKFNEIDARVHISVKPGRYYLETILDDDKTARILASTPGIVAFSRVKRVRKNLNDVFEASLLIAEECLSQKVGMSYKFEVRRVDKSLPLDSYGYARELGNLMHESMPELRVDVHQPDFIIRVELREWAYVYQHQQPGPGGLPVGTGGMGMLLLSGGIDSPVAGFLMTRRGLKLSAIYFHTPPYTSDEAHDKVVRLASTIAPWCGGLTFLSVPFTDCQMKIGHSVEPSTTTLHSRACMMRIAGKWAARRHCGALVTGESLGQVASQTLESIAYTNRTTDLPIFRPLIGMDKEEIIQLAVKIGTYETSVEPFDDCCTLFSPERPLTRPVAEVQQSEFESIPDLEELMDAAVSNTRVMHFDSHENMVSC